MEAADGSAPALSQTQVRMLEQVRRLAVDVERILVVEKIRVQRLDHMGNCRPNDYI